MVSSFCVTYYPMVFLVVLCAFIPLDVIIHQQNVKNNVDLPADIFSIVFLNILAEFVVLVLAFFLKLCIYKESGVRSNDATV